MTLQFKDAHGQVLGWVLIEMLPSPLARGMRIWRERQWMGYSIRSLRFGRFVFEIAEPA